MFKKLHLSKQKVRWFSTILCVQALFALVGITFSIFQFPVLAQNTSALPAVSLSQVASGLVRPVSITNAGDGSGRLFIVEQAGKILIFDETLSAEPFLDIEARVASPASGGGNEQGLLGLAYSPAYTEDGYFYVYYTMHGGDNVLSRFSVSGDPNSADPTSEEKLLVFPHPTYTNHNGGQLAFGPDGYLYIGTGDGGGGGDPLGNAQDPSSLSGKLLRIDVDNQSLPSEPFVGDHLYYLPIFCLSEQTMTGNYAVPDDNPFVDAPGFRPEIWALGLRNPWRFSFDRLTGDLFIADVGQNRWEEINFQPAVSLGGENYGWNIMEGEECYQSDSCNKTNLTLPVHVYQNFSSSNCSVTGGYVYRGLEIPGLDGVYIFGDFCSGTIWGLQKDGEQWQNEILTSTSLRISSFGEAENGEIFLTDISGGGMYQIVMP